MAEKKKTKKPVKKKTSRKKVFHVLYIEDGRALTHVMSNKLEREGFRVSLATDGEEGLRKVSALKPDLVLLDLILPNMNGFEVLRAIKEDSELKKIPVIIFTNLGQESDEQKSKQMGAANYFVKSDMSINEVIDKIREQLKVK